MRLAVVTLVMAMASWSALAKADCLKYEAEGTTLTGKVSRVTFPGPPNFESVKKGDAAEVTYVLHLATPICVDANAENDFDDAEKDVTDVQLALSSEQVAAVRGALKRGTLTVTGTLFHANTGHHHTAVLMQVDSVAK